MQPDTLAKLVALAKALSAHADLDLLAEVIVDTAAELTSAAGSSLLLFDEEDKALRYVSTTWCRSDAGKRAALEALAVAGRSGVAGWVMEANRPVTVEMTGRDPLVAPAVEELMDEKVRSIAAVPLAYRHLPIGVLECTNRRTGPFGPEDIEILQTLASLASVSIYNAHLLNRTEAAYAELAELDRLKTDFIAISSHELRTPLGVIIGHTAFLQEIVDREIREPVDAIARNARRLQEIIDNLSAVNQLQSADEWRDPAWVRPADLIRACVAAFSDEAEAKGIRLEEALAEPDLRVRADPEKLALVLNNLVRNALTFTAGAKDGVVRVSLERVAGQAVVSVIDNGIGIPARDLGRVFDRFFQVEGHMRRRHGGMGLGLSATKVMVESFGGTIEVESVEGAGSTFRFSLPAAAASGPLLR